MKKILFLLLLIPLTVKGGGGLVGPSISGGGTGTSGSVGGITNGAGIAAITMSGTNAVVATNGAIDSRYTGSSSGSATNLTVSGTIAGSPTVSGIWKYTNNPQVNVPAVQYITNIAITFVAQSPFITAASGSWNNWHRGDNLVASPGTNNDQYTFVGKINATTAEIYPPAGHNYVADTGCLIYPSAHLYTDINGGDYGLNIDSGGNINQGDASSDGGAPPAGIIGSPHLQYYDSAMYDLIQSGIYGVCYVIGGVSGEAITSRWAWFVNTTAHQFSGGVNSNNQVDVEFGLTNMNNGNGGGAVTNLGDMAFPLLGTNQPLTLWSGANGKIITNITGGSDGNFLMKSNAATGGMAWGTPAGGSVTMAALAAVATPTNMGASTNFDCLSSFYGYRSTTNTSIAFQLTNEQPGLSYIIRLDNVGATPPALVTITASTGRANTYVAGQASYAPTTNASLKIVIDCGVTTNQITYIDNYK